MSIHSMGNLGCSSYEDILGDGTENGNNCLGSRIQGSRLEYKIQMAKHIPPGRICRMIVLSATATVSRAFGRRSSQRIAANCFHWLH